MTTEEIIKKFGDYLAIDRKVSDRTVFSYSRMIGFFLADHPDPGKVTKNHINLYLAKLYGEGASINTTRLNQSAIKSFFHFWEDYSPGSKNPANAIPPIKEEVKVPKLPTPNQLLRFISAADMTTFQGRRNAAIVSLIADTGIRPREIEKITVGHIAEHETHLTLLVPKMKTRERLIPFCQLEATRFTSEYFLSYWQEITVLGSHLTGYVPYSKDMSLFLTEGFMNSGNPLKYRGVNMVFNRMEKVSGIEINPIHLRHFFATYSYINGTDLVRLRDLMGHAWLETTMRYIHVANTLDSKLLNTTATAGIKAPKHMQGYVKLYKDSQKAKKK